MHQIINMHDEVVDIQDRGEMIIIMHDKDDDEVLEDIIHLLGGEVQQVEQVFIDNELIEKQLVLLMSIHRFIMDDDEVLVVSIDIHEKVIMGKQEVQLIEIVKLKVEIFEDDDELHDQIEMHDDDLDESEQYVLCGEQVVHFQLMQNEKINM